jgi:predicted kinase
MMTSIQPSSSATVHLICGSTGAGKTTYATVLCKTAHAMHFSIDDWMVALFAPDMPTSPDWGWIGQRVARCENQIMMTALGLYALGVSSILDLVLLRADRRQDIVAALRAAGADLQLHWLDVDAGERWRRVSVRNAEKGETYRLTVSRPMFDFIETLWQPPHADELSAMAAKGVAEVTPQRRH